MWSAILVRLCLGGIPAAQVETVYVVPLSHTDIGFTAPPRTVIQGYVQAGEDALAAAREDPQFVWNFETFWQFEQWLKQQSDPAAMLDLVRQGRFGLSAAYVCPHTSLMSGWALDWLFRLPVEWGRAHGVQLDWAMINDVPGHPPDLPQYMAARGVRYLVLGVNQTLSKPLPDEVCNTPFWWESSDGSRVLVWISADNYTEAFYRYGMNTETGPASQPHEPRQTQPSEANMAEAMSAMMGQYAQRKYPFDSVLALHGFDNWGSRPAVRLSKIVQQWNARGEKPRLVLSTPRAFFKHIEDAYGAELPVRRGGFGGQWEVARLMIPTAMERARFRETTLVKQQDPSPADIGRLLAFWDHNFSMGLSWPGILTRAETVEHNGQLWEIIADWPLPPRGDRPRRPQVDLDQPGDRNPLRINRLYLEIERDGKIEYEKLSDEVHRLRSAERMPSGGLRLRHQIDRGKLPESARVVWTWKLTEDEYNSDVTVWTSSGTMKLRADALAGYSPDHWVAVERFKLARTQFFPHGPFCFYRSTEPYKWLFARVLDQRLNGRFKDGPASLTFEEAYPGEHKIYEFSIDVLGSGR